MSLNQEAETGGAALHDKWQSGHICLFVCLLYIQSIHTWSKPQDIEFVIINYIRWVIKLQCLHIMFTYIIYI
jgi:hypothetical protein